MSTLHESRSTPRATQSRSDLFMSPVVGLITTKTTIEISGRAMTDDEIEFREAQSNGSGNGGSSSTRNMNRSPMARVAPTTLASSKRTSWASTPKREYFPE